LTKHLGLVHHVARQIARRMSAHVDLDELVSAGTLGLIAAVDTFDATRSTAFSSFAAPRIRGAILDELRRLDHVPRSYRRKAREIAAARQSLDRSLGRAPEDAELARCLGVDEPTLRRWEREVEGTTRVAIDQPSDGASHGRHDEIPARTLADAAGETAPERLEREEKAAMLRDAIHALKDQARAVLGMYYFDELQMKDIAQVLGVSESRVSQIRKRALGELRDALAERMERAA
jgi:RNA polymerase sigma factor for flagellar operon FliA